MSNPCFNCEKCIECKKPCFDFRKWVSDGCPEDNSDLDDLN